MELNQLIDDYGSNAFTDEVMKERIPKSIYKAFHESLEKGEELSKECATVIANAMKIWAIEHGATHFTHWFTPMTGLTAEKHDAFLEPDSEFIDEVCSCLEDQGIHLTNDLLVQIISMYEEHKFKFFKDMLDQLVGQDISALSNDGGPAVVQVVMDGKRMGKSKDKDEEYLGDIDSNFLS